MTHLQHLQQKITKTKKKLFDTGLLSFAKFLPLFTLSALLIASLRLFQDTGTYGYVQAEFPLLSPALDTLVQGKYTAPIKMPSGTLTLEQTPTTLSLRTLHEAQAQHTVPYTSASLSDSLQRLLTESGASDISKNLIVLTPAANQPLTELIQLLAELRQVHHYDHILLAHQSPGRSP